MNRMLSAVILATWALAPPAAGAITGVKATHRAGQTLIVFTEPKLEELSAFKSESEVSAFRRAFLKRHPGAGFRIRRSSRPITAKNVAEAEVVGRCGFFTAFNSTYRQKRGGGKGAPIRYRVTDAGEQLPWGTGVYAHNPAKAGKAWYAVTVVAGGKEDLVGVSGRPVTETVGVGDPILQWIERPDPKKGWHFRRGKMVRLIYTRWESHPHSNRPSNPIDYLVAIPLEPK
ncbi:hypothetical protein LCGC14_1889240, partial [marine sediment metagenome]